MKGIQEKEVYTPDEWAIISEALKNYTLEHDNGIYVCIGAYFTDCDICYQETNYYTASCDFNAPYLEYREYKNIETGRVFRAYSSLEYVRSYARRYATLISDFERKATILNPTNSNKNDNDYEKVRREYFTAALEYGDEVAQEIILKRYPKISALKSKRKRGR